MPSCQALPFINTPVCARFGQPGYLLHRFTGKFNAILIDDPPVFIDQAAAGSRVQKFTSQWREFHGPRLVFHLLQTAYPTAIAKGLPLIFRHLFQGFRLPERLLVLIQSFSRQSLDLGSRKFRGALFRKTQRRFENILWGSPGIDQSSHLVPEGLLEVHFAVMLQRTRLALRNARGGQKAISFASFIASSMS